VSQIIANLLSNAVKFTETGEVRIWTEREGHLWKIYVSDTGIGFSEDQQQRIFVRFHQVDNSSTRRYGGSGLGLSISRQLAVAMGGELSASSQLGVGSTFCLTLPLPARER
jgi:signal transduction histidine kinase